MAYSNPIPGGVAGRTDQGVDISAKPGTPVVAIAPSRVIGRLANWYAGQPFEWFRILGTNLYWYAAEQINFTAKPGDTVQQGQQIGTYAASGTATEFGWGTASGNTLSVAHGTQNLHPNHSDTPEGIDFRQQVLGGAPPGAGLAASPGSRARGNAWRVSASQESDGGTGSCGPIGSGGLWYSELSTIPMGTASDFHGLGGLPCGTELIITNPANGKSVRARKRDVGAGSAFLPVMGIYPATAAAIGLSGGQYTVIIQRADGGALHPVRGTPEGAPAGANSGVTRPGAGGSTAGGSNAIAGLFTGYLAEADQQRKAPDQAGIDPLAPFKWWWGNFSSSWENVADQAGGLYGEVAGGISDVAGFLKFVAWIFHPRNLLRAAEFVTGLILMGFGLQASMQAFRESRGSGRQRSGLGRVVRRAAGATPAGRVVRVRKAVSAGRSQAKRERRGREHKAAFTRGKRAEERSGGREVSSRQMKKALGHDRAGRKRARQTSGSSRTQQRAARRFGDQAPF